MSASNRKQKDGKPKYRKPMHDFERQMKLRIRETEDLLKRELPPEKGRQSTVATAMLYSVMAGGKRLRPILIRETYAFFGGRDMRLVEPFMAAIEMIHTYSLIHDDLPALDNDDYRRGLLTSHKMFGEAMAILAGDALLNYAYEEAAKAFDAAETAGELRAAAEAMKILTHKPGYYGMLGGQVVDVMLTGKAIDADTLKFIFENKTGALIEACMTIGAVLAGADEKQMACILRAASCVGMAFQIQDDILDVTSSFETLGKPIHSDEKNEKTTWVSLYGLEQAQSDARRYSEEALALIAGMDGVEDAKDSFLYALVTWLIGRKY